MRLQDALNSNTEHYNLNSAMLGTSMDMDVDMLSPDLCNLVNIMRDPRHCSDPIVDESWQSWQSFRLASFQDLGTELELAVRNVASTSLLGTTSAGGNATRQRRHYASLDPASMGVDVQVGPVTNLTRSPDLDNSRHRQHAVNNATLVESLLNEANDEASNDAPMTSSTTSSSTTRSSADENMMMMMMEWPAEGQQVCDAAAAAVVADHQLPAGWERHEDDDGPYYWHIKSGTIQREMPAVCQQEQQQQQTQQQQQRQEVATTSVVTRSTTSFALSDAADSGRNREETALKYVAHCQVDHRCLMIINGKCLN